VIDAQHPRLLFSFPHAAAVHPGTQFASSAKSFPLKPFADHRHLTPFLSHLYKNVGGEGHLRFFGPTISTYPLSFHTIAHSFALFCTHARLNPTVFNRFRTLWGKHPGGGGANEIADREEEKMAR
jgi:hypothetical protein